MGLLLQAAVSLSAGLGGHFGGVGHTGASQRMGVHWGAGVPCRLQLAPLDVHGPCPGRR